MFGGHPEQVAHMKMVKVNPGNLPTLRFHH
jgi:hypothetical protein